MPMASVQLTCRRPRRRFGRPMFDAEIGHALSVNARDAELTLASALARLGKHAFELAMIDQTGSTAQSRSGVRARCRAALIANTLAFRSGDGSSCWRRTATPAGERQVQGRLGARPRHADCPGGARRRRPSDRRDLPVWAAMPLPVSLESRLEPFEAVHSAGSLTSACGSHPTACSSRSGATGWTAACPDDCR